MGALFPWQTMRWLWWRQGSETEQRKGEEGDAPLQEKGTVLSQRGTSNPTPVSNEGRGKGYDVLRQWDKTCYSSGLTGVFCLVGFL